MEKKEEIDDLKLKSECHYFVARLCEEYAARLDRNISKHSVATINEVLVNFISAYAHDIENFTLHGQRTVARSADVLLFARRNPRLFDELGGNDADKEIKPKKKRQAKTDEGESNKKKKTK